MHRQYGTLMWFVFVTALVACAPEHNATPAESAESIESAQTVEPAPEPQPEPLPQPPLQQAVEAIHIQAPIEGWRSDDGAIGFYDLDAAELRIVRNAIYARHGRPFQSADLQQFFGDLDWYAPDTDAQIVLTDMDARNLRIVMTREANLQIETMTQADGRELTPGEEAFVGIWQASDSLIAGVAPSYAFFPNGTVVWRAARRDCGERERARVGTWSFQADELTLNYTHRLYEHDGSVVEAAGGNCNSTETLIGTMPQIEEVKTTARIHATSVANGLAHDAFVVAEEHYHRLTRNVSNRSTWIELAAILPDTPDRQPTGTFVTVWRTGRRGVSQSNQITLPLVENGSYDFTIYWGDGTSDRITQWNEPAVTHTYAVSGEYELKMIGEIIGWSFSPTGGRPGFPSDDDGRYLSDVEKIVEVRAWGPLVFGETRMQFAGTNDLSITALDAPNLSATTSLHNAFLYVDFGANVAPNTTWNTQTVVDMSYMFNGVQGDVSTIGNIGDWDVSNVTDMSWMFHDAETFNEDIGRWNTSKVTNMEAMFRIATAFDQDISGWDVSNVTNMQEMFRYAGLSSENYDALLMSWSAQSVQSGVEFDAGQSKPRSAAALEARKRLIDEYGWTITDGGLAE